MNALEKELLKEKQRTEKLLKNISENLKTMVKDDRIEIKHVKSYKQRLTLISFKGNFGIIIDSDY